MEEIDPYLNQEQVDCGQGANTHTHTHKQTVLPFHFISLRLTVVHCDKIADKAVWLPSLMMYLNSKTL